MNNKIQNDFPWFSKHKNLIYFDSAATTLKPKKVLNAINDYYINYGTNTHNIDSSFAFKTNEKIYECRKKVAALFNTNLNNIIFTSGATESLNLVANGLKKFLKKNDEILLSNFEHASNLLPWIVLAKEKKIKLKYLNTKSIPNENDYINGIANKTKVVTFAATSNIMGNAIDYFNLTKKIKQKKSNIIIVMDAAQYLPHHKINVKCGIDFVCASAHKLLGPTGLGITYMSNKWIETLSPIRFGGGMNKTIMKNNYIMLNNFSKFEGGTLPLAQIFGFGVAIDYLNSFGWTKIQKHLSELTKYLLNKLKEIKNLIIYSQNPVEPIIFFNIKNVHAQDLANWLGKKGIICRAGLSCAKLAKNTLKTDAAVRISLYFYNTKHEINKFILILKNFKKGDEIII